MDFLDNSSFSLQDNIKLHEQFVQNLNGTTMAEVFLLTTQIPFLAFITIFLEICGINTFSTHASTSESNFSNYVSKLAIFLLEFAILVCPIILLVTTFSDFLIITLLAVVSTTFLIIICCVSYPDISILYWKLPYTKRDFLTDSLFLTKQPFITYFRSLVFISTTISILGVDFQIYPRRFAKTETYGVSIMDLGVGLFVLSNALVRKNNDKTQDQGFYKTSLESFVFLIFGVIRYYLVQHLNYQQHLSEYGIHWNFFITLALVKFVSHLIMKLSKGYNMLCGVTILIIHQYLLSSSLENYVMSDIERDGWLSANREGIVSLSGYLGLFFLGVSIANIIEPVNSKNTVENKLKTLIHLFSIGFCLSLLSYYLNTINCKISRRLANPSYVIWVTALSVILLAVTLMVELLCICFFPVKPNLKSKLYSIITPTLLESINYNGLLFFLLSNLLTGLVNMSIDVLNMDTYRSIFILTIYMIVNCSVVFVFLLNNIKLKLW